MPAGVFISYRREDSAADAGRLYDGLCTVLGAEQVFRDVSSGIDAGANFQQALGVQLQGCAAVIAVIGPRWLDITSDDGVRRLDKTDDYVRGEIASGLERGARVIPALVRGATLPKREQLPSELRGLTEGQAVALRDDVWADDLGRLVEVLERLLHMNAVGRGFRQLAELMVTPSIRALAIRYRTVFEGAASQIEALATLKKMHDRLHTLQFHCFSPLLHEARRAATASDAWDLMPDYAVTLEDTTRALREIASTADLIWIGRLELAAQEFRAALRDLDAARLKPVLEQLNRVLSIQPPTINGALVATARLLRLSDLREAMAGLRNSLALMQLNGDQLQPFDEAVQRLDWLGESLSVLIRDHDVWQAIETELRMIEDTLVAESPQTAGNGLPDWQYVKSLAEPLYAERPDSWAVELAQDAQRLDQMLTDGDAVRIRQSFRSFRRRAGAHFFDVDVRLREQCDDLRRVGDSIAVVVERSQ